MKRFATRTFATLAVPATAGALLVAPATAAVAATKPPKAPLACTASVSNSRPHGNSTVNVNVSTVRGASVKGVARFKTGPQTVTGTANARGNAQLSYSVGRAATGYRVNVNVTVASGRSSGSCSTSFIPR
jgi:hypothetical protein